MSRRADLLATRLEAGVAQLAELAEGLSEAEWRTTVRDGRPVGVIVHHVANMYPIEIDVARTVAGGKPVEGVTWEVVADINAKHAVEKANVTKAEELIASCSEVPDATGLAFTYEPLSEPVAATLDDADSSTGAVGTSVGSGNLTVEIAVVQHGDLGAWFSVLLVDHRLNRRQLRRIAHSREPFDRAAA